MESDGTVIKISSTYQNIIGGGQENLSAFKAFISKSCTMSVIIGDKGDPIGELKVCLYIILLNVKKVEFKTSLIAFKNSDSGKPQTSRMKHHLFETLKRAKSIGTFVNKETSSEINFVSLSIKIFNRLCTKSKLLLIWLGRKILHHNLV